MECISLSIPKSIRVVIKDNDSVKCKYYVINSFLMLVSFYEIYPKMLVKTITEATRGDQMWRSKLHKIIQCIWECYEVIVSCVK